MNHKGHTGRKENLARRTSGKVVHFELEDFALSAIHTNNQKR